MHIKQINPVKFILVVCIAATIVITTYFIGYSSVNHLVDTPLNILYDIIFSFFISASIATVNYYTIINIDSKIPWERNKTKRFLIELLITNFNAAFLISSLVLFLHYILNYDIQCFTSLASQVYNESTIAVIINTIAVAIYEGQMLIRNWLLSLIEVEQLRREKAESQYSVLKNQVNPHFLFNSLNSLSSLIRLSPDKAIEFVDKFSKIYRYVLDVSDKMVIEICHEIEFLQAYYFLQKIRFGNNLIIEVVIDANKMNDFILPLSVQLLIENAIKHNEISSEKQLKISVSVDDQYLVITNNLQLKDVFETSNGIGINNLTERYKHFTEIEPKFYSTQDYYIAKIPILHDNG